MSTPDETSPQIATVAVLTCDRDSAVRRALAAHRDTLSRWGRHPRLLVVDDSRAGAPGQEGVLDRPGRRILARDLAKEAGLEPDRVTTALVAPAGTFGAGAARNALALATTGGMVFCCDDDILPRIAAVGPLDGVLRAGSAVDPTRIQFLDAAEDLERRLLFRPFDVLAELERFLGRRPGDLPQVTDGTLASPNLRSRWNAPATRIRVAGLGIAGDCAMRSSTWYLQLEGASRADLLASEASWSRRTSRRVIRAAPLPTVTDTPFLGAGVTAFDHRQILPPFPGWGRGEDAVFATALQALHPEALIGHLPLVAVHEPDEPRTFDPDDTWRSAPRVYGSTALFWCIRSAPPVGAHPVLDRYGVLGGHLCDVAALSDADLLAFLRDKWLQHADGMQHIWSAHLRAGGPPHWESAVRQAREAVAERLHVADAPIPEDTGPAADPVARLQGFRSLLAAYGWTLRHWPALHRAAATLIAALFVVMSTGAGGTIVVPAAPRTEDLQLGVLPTDESKPSPVERHLLPDGTTRFVHTIRYELPAFQAPKEAGRRLRSRPQSADFVDVWARLSETPGPSFTVHLSARTVDWSAQFPDAAAVDITWVLVQRGVQVGTILDCELALDTNGGGLGPFTMSLQFRTTPADVAPL